MFLDVTIMVFEFMDHMTIRTLPVTPNETSKNPSL